METRTIRFNIRDFLEYLVIEDNPEDKSDLFDDFKRVYRDSGVNVRKQINSYLKRSVIYRENSDIRVPIDAIIENFHM